MYTRAGWSGPLYSSWSYSTIPIFMTGWLGEAKVLCILHHWGVQLILTCSWARPAILAAGKGRGWMFLFLLFLYCHSFSFLLYPSLSSPLLSLFSLSLGDDTKWPTRVDVSLKTQSKTEPHCMALHFVSTNSADDKLMLFFSSRRPPPPTPHTHTPRKQGLTFHASRFHEKQNPVSWEK